MVARGTESDSHACNGYLLTALRPYSSRALKPEPRLQLDHTPGQAARRTPEVWIGNNRSVVEKADRLEVQLVEDVEEIGAQLKVGLFTNKARQTGVLHDARVR